MQNATGASDSYWPGVAGRNGQVSTKADTRPLVSPSRDDTMVAASHLIIDP